jgi:hypothetical protein
LFFNSQAARQRAAFLLHVVFRRTFAPVIGRRLSSLGLFVLFWAMRNVSWLPCFVWLGLLFAAHPSTVIAAELTRPNIILIVTDDLGCNDLGESGRKDHRTPHLDKLAGESLNFKRAYCSQPICSPSRAGLLTGRAPARLHLTTYLPGRDDCSAQKLLQPKIRQHLPLEEKTLAEHFRDAGYRTACIGKWHLGSGTYAPTNQGFEFYYQGTANTEPSAQEGGKGNSISPQKRSSSSRGIASAHSFSTSATTLPTFPTKQALKNWWKLRKELLSQPTRQSLNHWIEASDNC